MNEKREVALSLFYIVFIYIVFIYIVCIYQILILCYNILIINMVKLICMEGIGLWLLINITVFLLIVYYAIKRIADLADK